MTADGRTSAELRAEVRAGVAQDRDDHEANAARRQGHADRNPGTEQGREDAARAEDLRQAARGLR